MNVVIASGNLGQDPELQYTQSGKKVLKNSLAVRGYKGKTTWVNFTAWEKTAELIAQYCEKGNKLGIRGEIAVDSWEDSNGKKQYRTYVLVAEIDFMQKSKGGENDPPEQHYTDDVPF